jgi:hypothetical protein
LYVPEHIPVPVQPAAVEEEAWWCHAKSCTGEQDPAQVKMPQIGFCEEKSRLLSDFLQSVRELSAIQNEQTQAVIDGDSDFSRF